MVTGLEKYILLYVAALLPATTVNQLNGTHINTFSSGAVVVNKVNVVPSYT